MIRIFLTGYMGAGKTTLGKAFARELGLTFIDLDWYIEERFHRTISELFRERGEDGFRRLEQSMLHEAGEFEDVVISTGGGRPPSSGPFYRARRTTSCAPSSAVRWRDACLTIARLATASTAAGWKTAIR